MDDNQVTAYMRLAQANIGRAFVADGLYIHHYGACQGPHTLTFTLRLYEPTRARIKKALDLAQAIEANLQAAPVRIYSDAGAIVVEIPSPWPQIVDGTTLRGRGLAVPLGLTSRKLVAGIDFNTAPHLLCVGPTQRGKTTGMRGLAFHLARQNRPGDLALLAFTFKPEDWQPFAALAHCWDVITNPVDAVAALTWLRDTMQQRTQQTIRKPTLFAFVDDLANLLAAAPGVSDLLVELASMGRAAGIHLVIGTQRLGEKGAGDALISANITTRLVFGTASAQDAAMYTGRGGTGAHQIGAHPGDALLVTDGGVLRLAVGYITDAHLATLRQSSRTLQPWRTPQNAPAPAPAPLVLRAETPKYPPPVVCAPGAAAPLIEVPAGLLRRQPTEADTVALRQLYRQLGGTEAIYRELKIKKNGTRAKWLRQALGL